MNHTFDNNGPDSEDMFQLKPLTQGLGFHKKVIELKGDATGFDEPGPRTKKSDLGVNSGLWPEPLSPSRTTLTIPKSLPHFEIPKKDDIKPHSFSTTTAPVSTPLSKPVAPSSPTNRPAHKPTAPLLPRWQPSMGQHDIFEKNRKPSSQEKTSQIPSSLNTEKALFERAIHCWPAALFDAVMVTGLTFLFAAVVFALTQIDFGEFTTMFQEDVGTRLAVVILIIAVWEVYSVAARTFFDRTLGEWTFGYWLGTPQDHRKLLYPVKVATRAFLVAITGFIFFPLLNHLFKKDILGVLLGLPLYF